MQLLSVVVPCYREEKNLAALYEALTDVLAGAPYAHEIILVDDGSPDGTWQEASRLADLDPKVKAISFSRNFGKEAAMLAGLKAAKGDSVVLMDGDLQHPPSLIPRMVEAFEGGFDQVIAKRDRAGDPFGRTVLSRAYYRLVDRLVDVSLEDGAGDFRLLSRRAVTAVTTLTERTRFSKGLFAWVGFSTVSLTYRNVDRAEGASSWSIGSLINYGIDGAMSFNNKPLRMVIWLGSVVTALTALYVVWLVANAIFGGIDVPGYVTIVALVTGLGGVQLISLGVIGEYVGRVFVEVKQRPHYVVSRTLGNVDAR